MVDQLQILITINFTLQICKNTQQHHKSPNFSSLMCWIFFFTYSDTVYHFIFGLVYFREYNSRLYDIIQQWCILSPELQITTSVFEMYSWTMYFAQVSVQVLAPPSLASWPEAPPLRIGPPHSLLSWRVDKLAFWLVSALLLSKGCLLIMWD